MTDVYRLQAELEVSNCKIDALHDKVALSLEVIEDLRGRVQALEAELADVRELVPVYGGGKDCDMSVEEAEARANVFTRALTAEELSFLASMNRYDFLDETIAERTASNTEFPAMVAKCQARRNSYGLGDE